MQHCARQQNSFFFVFLSFCFSRNTVDALYTNSILPRLHVCNLFVCNWCIISGVRDVLPLWEFLGLKRFLRIVPGGNMIGAMAFLPKSALKPFRGSS